MSTLFYPTITTTRNSNWRSKINEVKKLGLKEVCFFPTCLNPTQRKEAYQLLEKTSVEQIPLVHLRSDMDKDEINYFMKRFKTKKFNIHPQEQHKSQFDLTKFSKMIYVEISNIPFTEEELKANAGICLDVSHLEDLRLQKNEKYQFFIKMLQQYPCGVGHISTILKKRSFYAEASIYAFSRHFLNYFNQLDYVKQYRSLLPPVMAIELENTIQKQLEIKSYLEKLLVNL